MVAMLLALSCVGCDISQKATFQVQVQLQALYEEMAEGVINTAAGAASARTTAVLYTPDWVFVDASGQRQSLEQARSESSGALHRSPFDTITHAIQKLTVSGDQVTVIVKVAVATGGADVDQRFAAMGRLNGWQERPDNLPRVETTTFRDTWVKAGDSWKMKSREQLGKPDVRAASANVY